MPRPFIVGDQVYYKSSMGVVLRVVEQGIVDGREIVRFSSDSNAHWVYADHCTLVRPGAVVVEKHAPPQFKVGDIVNHRGENHTVSAFSTLTPGGGTIVQFMNKQGWFWAADCAPVPRHQYFQREHVGAAPRIEAVRWYDGVVIAVLYTELLNITQEDGRTTLDRMVKAIDQYMVKVDNPAGF